MILCRALSYEENTLDKSLLSEEYESVLGRLYESYSESNAMYDDE